MILKKKIVSISVVTYQHNNYIKQCLDSILLQKTNFPFEIILGEDESIDGTREICEEYAKKHPNKIKLFFRNRKDVVYINGNATGRYNFIENLKACKSKYIALCEGDDYWTDPLKLQKQVDFMEANPDYGICFHNVEEKNTLDKTKSRIIPNVKQGIDFTVNDYIVANKTATCSMLFKSNLFNPIPSWFAKVPFGDLAIILTVLKASNAKAHVLNDVMGVYRIHQGGIHGSFQKSNKSLINAYKQHIQFFKIIKKELLFEKKYNKAILTKFEKTNKTLASLYKNNGQTFKAMFAKARSKSYKVRKRFL